MLLLEDPVQIELIGQLKILTINLEFSPKPSHFLAMDFTIEIYALMFSGNGIMMMIMSLYQFKTTHTVLLRMDAGGIVRQRCQRIQKKLRTLLRKSKLVNDHER